jgi:probable F420-dependent oxidoreductase
MSLPLASEMKFGLQTLHRRSEPAEGPWLPDPAEARRLVELCEGFGYDSIWVGDHLAFTIPILDPLLQLAHAAAYAKTLTFGTGVYLAPLRHPTPTAKMVATLDHLTGGRLIFGVGVGGEFPGEYAACNVPLEERGARLSEIIPLLKKLWSGEKVSNEGRFYPIPETLMLPAPRQPGGPPIWCGGRQPAALKRAGEIADGYLSYVITPEMYADALAKIEAAADAAGRRMKEFGTGHLLFTRIDESYEKALDAATQTLSVRYNMDFRRAAERYAALGNPADVAARIGEFRDAGLRHCVVDLVGPFEERDAQIERFASEVMPLLKS